MRFPRAYMSLKTLPVELVLCIASFLETRSALRLAFAWKWFLQAVVPAWDPLRNQARQDLRLRSSLALFLALQRSRFREKQDPSCCVLWEEYRGYFEEANEDFVDALMEWLRVPMLHAQPLLLDVRSAEGLWESSLWVRRDPSLLSIRLYQCSSIMTERNLQAIANLLLAPAPCISTLHIGIPPSIPANSLPLQSVWNAIARNSTLCHLGVGMGTLHAHQMESICVSICQNESLSEFCMSTSCDMLFSGIRYPAMALTRLLCHPQLTKLQIQGSRVDWQVCGPGLEFWSEAVATNRTLAELNLHGCQLPSSVVQQLARGLARNTTLCVLNLCKSNVDDEGAKALAEMLRHNLILRVLNLNSNRITSQGLHAFREPLLSRTTALRYFSFGDNPCVETDTILFVYALLRHYQQHNNQQPMQTTTLHFGGSMVQDGAMQFLLGLAASNQYPVQVWNCEEEEQRGLYVQLCLWVHTTVRLLGWWSADSLTTSTMEQCRAFMK